MNTKLRDIEWSYRFHKVWQWLSWLLIIPGGLFTLASLYLKIFIVPSPGWIFPIRTLGFTLLSAWLIFGFVWLLVAGWYSLTFRYLAWWVCRMFGWLWRWLRTNWIGLLLTSVAVIILLWLLEALLGQIKNPVKFLDAQVLQVLAAVAIIILLIAGYRSSKRIVITDFADYTQGDGAGKTFLGLASYLNDRLAYRVGVYRTIDEALPHHSKGIIHATINVSDVGVLLKNAISSDDKIKIGLIEIPVGSMADLVGKLFQGPQLTGSLHKMEGKNKGDDTLMLEARLSGGGYNQRWRVLSTDLEHPQQENALTLHEMVDQLASRIFTNLTDVGSKKWQAVAHYTEGLYQYRKTLNVKGELRPRLHSAEKAFLQALTDDVKFSQCHYNLGIVYRDLMQKDSAITAFRQALAGDSENYGAFCALAENLYPPSESLGETEITHLYTEIIRLCDYAIYLQPLNSQAWNLKGNMVERQIAENDTRSPIWRPIWSPIWGELVFPLHAKTTALAWRKLCLSALAGKLNPDIKTAASLALSNLANGYSIRATCRRDHKQPAVSVSERFLNWIDDIQSMVLFRQSLAIEPRSARTRLEFTYMLVNAKRWEQALNILEHVDESLLINEKQAVFWTYLAKAHAAIFSKESAKNQQKHAKSSECRKSIIEQAFNHYLDCGAVLGGEIFKISYGDMILDWKSTLQIIKNPYSELVSSLGEFYKWLKGPYKRTSVPEGYKKWQWARAQIALCVARNAEKQEKWEHVRQALLRAINFLQKEHVRQIQSEDLYSRLAVSYINTQDFNKALVYANKAADLDPEKASSHEMLGKVYFYLDDYDQAEAELNVALSIEPAQRDILLDMILIYWYRGLTLQDPEKRKKAFERVVGLLNNTLEIWQIPNVNLFSRTSQNVLVRQFKFYGWIHHWLGRFYNELGQIDQTILHLQIASQAELVPLESLVALSDLYMDTEAYDKADATARKAVCEVQRQKLARQIKFDVNYKSDSSEECQLADFLVMALVNLAQACVERGIRLEWAKRQLNYAAHFLDRNSNTWRTQNQVDYHNCWGLIYLSEKNLAKAIVELEKAKDLKTDAFTQYLFVQIYCKRAEQDPSFAKTWLYKAQQSIGLLEKIDLRNIYLEKGKKALHTDQGS
jgi:tetratricopeptide (TPR) repeat protein